MFSSANWQKRCLIAALAFCFFGQLSDIVSTKLNDKYSFWADITESNTLVASPDGHAIFKYLIAVKITWFFTFLAPLSFFIYLGTGSMFLASFPFWYDGFQLLLTAGANFMLLARFHHFLHP